MKDGRYIFKRESNKRNHITSKKEIFAIFAQYRPETPFISIDNISQNFKLNYQTL